MLTACKRGRSRPRRNVEILYRPPAATGATSSSKSLSLPFAYSREKSRAWMKGERELPLRCLRRLYPMGNRDAQPPKRSPHLLWEPQQQHHHRR